MVVLLRELSCRKPRILASLDRFIETAYFPTICCSACGIVVSGATDLNSL